jgi:hypothetical protein
MPIGNSAITRRTFYCNQLICIEIFCMPIAGWDEGFEPWPAQPPI